MPWSTLAHDELAARRSALSPVIFFKDVIRARNLFALGAVCLFVFLVVRSFVSSSVLLLNPVNGSSAPPEQHFSFSPRPDTGAVKADSLKNDTLKAHPAPATVDTTSTTPADTESVEQEPDSTNQDTTATNEETEQESDTTNQTSVTRPHTGNDTTTAVHPDSLNKTSSLPQQTVKTLSDSTYKNHPSVDSLKALSKKFPKGVPPPKLPVADTSQENNDEESADSDSLSDSLSVVSDSTKKDSTKDTTYVVFLDSTWRMQQHRHHRVDNPSVDVFPRYHSSLYLMNNSPALQRDMQIDSASGLVTIREQVNGLDVKVPTTLTMDEYIHQRLEYERLNNWRSMTYEYNLAEHQKGLESFFGSFTKIDIPVPPNPIFSIFGKNKISLHITGAVDIKAGFKSTTSDVQTISSADKTLNEPNFNQDVQINVDGSIGDKLKIGADWNTQRTFEYENSLKIKYQGYDDEIIKSVEAGNVSLNVPSFVGSSQALFGIKTQMQFGPLSVTALVSQKKGSSKEVSISGGTQTIGTDIPILKYSTLHYFVDSAYLKIYEDYHAQISPVISSDEISLQISEINVYKTASNQQVTGKRTANAYYYLPPKATRDGKYPDAELTSLTQTTGIFETGSFIQLVADKDYTIDMQQGIISLNTPLQDAEVLAIAYSTVGNPGANNQNTGRLFYGEFADASTADTTRPLILKLIKPTALNPAYSGPWSLLMKNVYSLGARDIKKDGLDIKIMYKPNGSPESTDLLGTNMLQLTGLDRYNNSNQPTGDFVFDYYPNSQFPNYTIDPVRGEIFFPTLRPFDTTLAQQLRKKNVTTFDSTLLIHDIYDSKLNTTNQNSSNDNIFVIRASVAGAVSARIPLNSFNIVEGSVQVIFNGTPLTPGVDYDVNYIIGEVNIRKQEALVPGANLQVKYEQNDLFQLAAKTLMGARGELDVNRDSKLGFTIMNLNQQTLSDKVRIGEEPTSNTILGVDGSTQWNLPFVTAGLNLLPGLHSREMSSLHISGEGAYILPNPNTKTSTVTSDNGASVAYIDDFEGARRLVPLNVNYTSWKPASVPVHTLLDPFVTINDTLKMFSKAKLSWYNNSQAYEAVSVQQIWPNKSVRQGEELVPLLIMDYDPMERGMYNYSLDFQSTLRDHPEKNWNGIQRYIASIAGDLTSQNLNYIELWVKASSADSVDLSKGKLYIDIGRVSEDVIPDGKLNSEDIIKTADNPGGIPNGIINNGEDVGLDMLDDDQERSKYAAFVAAHPDLAGDPSGDDYNYTSGSTDFSHINGTEGNYLKNALDGRFPDTEDLKNSGTVDATNSYIEYEIPLAESLSNGDRNRFIVGGGTNKWYQLRIALSDTTRVEGGELASSILQNVQFIRLWLSGYSKPVRVRIAEINFVGNQWLETSNDSTMKVTVVSVEDNPNYTSPPGVQRERDKTQPDQVIYANEQALALDINDLAAGDHREVAKYFAQRPMDMFSYKQLKMFVHGDAAFGTDAEVYLRFGADTLNYYEYSQPLKADWDEMTVIFNELTSIKAARDSGANSSRIAAPSGPAGSFYSIRGNPAITQVKYIGIGVRNIAGQYPSKTRYIDPPRVLRGEVWVNEMRVIDADNSPGGAYRFDTQLKLADFGNVGYNYSYTGPNFHGIDVAFGDRITHKSWAVNTSFAVDHFLPQDWQGASLPIAYSHQENIALPKYQPNTDVVVTQAAQRASERASTPDAQQAAYDKIVTESQTVSVSDNFAISSLKFGLPWKVWYVRDILNALGFRFNYSSTNSRDPATITSTSWQWGFGVNYGVALNHDLSIQPFSKLFGGLPLLDDYKDWKLYLFPITQFSGSIDGGRSHAYALARAQNSLPRDTRAFNANKQFGFNWKLTEGGLIGFTGDYGISVKRDLLYLDTAGNRGFSQLLHALFFGGRDGQYGQTVNINTKPKIPNILDINKYLDQISASYRVNYGWQNSFQGGDVGKSAGWDNSISLGTNFRLKALADSWFKDDASESMPNRTPVQRTPPPPPHSAGPDTSKNKGAKDTTAVVPDTGAHFNPLQKLKTAFKILIKYPLLDYDNINISFQQGNHSANSGVVGGTGFSNFWGVMPFNYPNADTNGGGPSRMYQLGLVSDPSATLRFTSHFPFLEPVAYRGADGWQPDARGLRARALVGRANLTDDFSQKNDIALKTSRPLWDGASLELSWKVDWQYHKTTTFQTDSLTGLPLDGTTRVTGTVERSFFTLPPVFLFKSFHSGLEQVGKLYTENMASSQYANRAGAAAADAFERGMEALPFLSKVFGEFVPRLNWSFHWTGIEKLAGITSWMQSLSLDHAYHGTFHRDFQIGTDGTDQTTAERISYDYSPLIGINMTFKDLLKGNLGGTFQYKTSTALDLSLSDQKITEDLTTEMSFTANYSRHGFEFPLFGLHLKNDLELSLTYSRAKKSRRSHDPLLLETTQDGTPLDGDIRTTMEPRIRYTLSSRVTASVYYRYTRTAPDEGGSTIPGTTSNEAGLDLHISIQ